jgi:hypothetical protein
LRPRKKNQIAYKVKTDKNKSIFLNGNLKSKKGKE